MTRASTGGEDWQTTVTDQGQCAIFSNITLTGRAEGEVALGTVYAKPAVSVWEVRTRTVSTAQRCLRPLAHLLSIHVYIDMILTINYRNLNFS